MYQREKCAIAMRVVNHHSSTRVNAYMIKHLTRICDIDVHSNSLFNSYLKRQFILHN
jgi:hypothetical protein